MILALRGAIQKIRHNNPADIGGQVSSNSRQPPPPSTSNNHCDQQQQPSVANQKQKSAITTPPNSLISIYSNSSLCSNLTSTSSTASSSSSSSSWSPNSSYLVTSDIAIVDLSSSDISHPHHNHHQQQQQQQSRQPPTPTTTTTTSISKLPHRQTNNNNNNHHHHLKTANNNTMKVTTTNQPVIVDNHNQIVQQQPPQQQVVPTNPTIINLGSSERLHVVPHDFEFLKVIGKGSFGKVYLAKHKKETNIYAIKVLSKQMILKHNEKRHVMSERNVLLQNLKHPFLVGLHYSFQSKDKLYFVLDYANGGEMFYHLQKERVFDETRAKFYAAEITSALGYLHSEGIVYRDLKPENILLDSSGHLVLTDFGLCKEGIRDLDTTTTFCGTPEYLAPEVLRKEAYDRCVDWWCLGAVLYEMLYGLPPFFSQDRTEMYDNILHQPVRFRSNASPEARHILEGLLSKNKQNRIGFIGGADEVKGHEFFRPINWIDLEAKNIRPPYNPNVADQLDVKNIDPEFITEPIPSSVWRHNDLGVTNSFPEDAFQGFSYAPSLINK